MRKLIFSFVMVVVCAGSFAPLGVCAQSGGGAAAGSGSGSGSGSKEENAVAAAVESLRKALIDPTKANLDNIALDELTYGHSNGTIQDKAAFEEALLTGKSDFLTIELTDQTVKVMGNTAWVRHTLTATNNDGGKPGTAHLYVLLVWMKAKGQWRLLARQAVKVPV